MSDYEHQRISELEDQLAEYEEQYAMIMAEQCPTDEKHCACVPVLRAKLKEAEVSELDVTLARLPLWVSA